MASLRLSLFLAPLLALACSASPAGEADAPEADGDGESAEGALVSAEPPPVRTVESYASTAPVDRVVAKVIPATALHGELAVGTRLTFVRTMVVANVPALLGIDGTAGSVLLEKSAVDASTREPTPADGANPYLAALAHEQSADAALSHLAHTTQGTKTLTLTIDMCQSSKPWEKRLFDALIALSEARHAAIPIGIAMTGGWAKAHPQELAQLKAWDAEKKLAITWVNHSYTHPLNCTPDKKTCTFLTAPSVDFQSEVLDNERFLLRQGVTVSSLFRFPGLVHDHARRSELTKLSLFALDSDAWLAKGEPMHDGAVVLVHGNGNEARGIDLFLAAMKSAPWQGDFASGKATFVSPLRAIPISQ